MKTAAKSRGYAEAHKAAPLVLTIGHSTRPIDEFIDLLQGHGVERLIDIRTIPRSRHNPQFNREALAKCVDNAGVDYAHIKELGGLRHPRPDSLNKGWRNSSFRGYADYMQTREFEQALDRLVQLCAEKRCALMCAEAVPWRCHRSLLADALVARGMQVAHIMSGTRSDVHNPTPFARIENGKIIYPQPEENAVRKPAAPRQAELKFNEAEAGMPSKNRKPKFSAAKEARRRARLAAGAPPGKRVIEDKRRKPPKHKKSLQDFVEL